MDFPRATTHAHTEVRINEVWINEGGVYLQRWTDQYIFVLCNNTWFLTVASFLSWKVWLGVWIDHCLWKDRKNNVTSAVVYLL